MPNIDIPGWSLIVSLLGDLLIGINNAVGNPGLAIIIFTIIVKLATVPLTMRSIRSGRRMQEVAPLIKEVQKKYKDDKAQQQTEVMRIYQEHNVNPMGSCLPMIVQIPIFLLLYQALSNLVGINGHTPNPDFIKPFLWVPNLAQKDPIYIWPVVSAIFQFVSQRMSMPYGVSKNADPQQAMTNKIMQFMPLYLLVVYLNFAAGAVIYWTFSSIFTCVQTYFVNGFGALPEVPGFKWLPKRELKSISPEIKAELIELEATNKNGKPTRRPTVQPNVSSQARIATATANGNGSGAATAAPEPKGFFNKMMAQAVAQQQAQAVAKQQPGAQNGADGVAETIEATESLEDAGATRPLSGANGAQTTVIEPPSAAAIDRKRRSKR